MDDQQPQVARQQQNAENVPQNRGRGAHRGRGPPRRYDVQRRRAQGEINLNGPPVVLDGRFLGFTSLQRGNAKVQINEGFTEIVADGYRNTISTNQSSKGFFDQNGQPMELNYLTRGLAGGLCLSTAVKLIQATPNSQLPSIATYRSFREFQLSVPRTFVQILDLIGKTDYDDWVIRIAENAPLIKRMLLKSIKYFKQNQDFVDDFVFLPDEARNRFNGLDNLPYTEFKNVYFDDLDSVKSIKQRAKVWLEVQLATNFQIDVNGEQVTFAYPQLPPVLNAANIVNWLGMFHRNFHPNFNQIMLTGVLLLVDLRWLENPDMRMADIDPAYAGTAVADANPVQLLNASGLHFYTEFLSTAHFIQLSRSCFMYYEATILQRLKSIFALTTQGTSSVGSPAQLVFTPEDMNVDKGDHGLPRVDIDPNLNHCLSYVNLKIADRVTKSAMIHLVRDVELDPDYQGHFGNSLVGIRNTFLNLDGVVYAQQNQN